MADNIKYIRWAAKILRWVIIINVLIGFGGMFFTVGITGVSGARAGAAAIPVGFITVTFQFLSVLINAFILYTVSRGLDLLADVAYHLLQQWHKQNQAQKLEPEWQSRKFN